MDSSRILALCFALIVASMVRSISVSFGDVNFNFGSFTDTSSGDEISCFFSHVNDALGSLGGYLGLINSSHSMKNRLVTIEFNTETGNHFNISSDNHVRNYITAWIDYKNHLRLLNIFLRYSDAILTNTSIKKPLLSMNVDLSSFLKDEMYVDLSVVSVIRNLNGAYQGENNHDECAFLGPFLFSSNGLLSNRFLKPVWSYLESEKCKENINLTTRAVTKLRAMNLLSNDVKSLCIGRRSVSAVLTMKSQGISDAHVAYTPQVFYFKNRKFTSELHYEVASSGRYGEDSFNLDQAVFSSVINNQQFNIHTIFLTLQRLVFNKLSNFQPKKWYIPLLASVALSGVLFLAWQFFFAKYNMGSNLFVKNLSATAGFRLLEALFILDFWLMWSLYFLGIGSGVTVLNNLAQFGIALRIHNTIVLLCIFSFCNFVGRLSSGALSEHFEESRAMPRTVWMTLAQILMVLDFFLYTHSSKIAHYIAIGLLGTCYGCQYALMVPTSSELFGLEHFGTIYSFMILGNPIGAVFFSVLLAGRLYDDAATREGDSTCCGPDCFRHTFIILACLCEIGAILVVTLTHQPGFHQIDQNMCFDFSNTVTVFWLCSSVVENWKCMMGIIRFKLNYCSNLPLISTTVMSTYEDLTSPYEEEGYMNYSSLQSQSNPSQFIIMSDLGEKNCPICAEEMDLTDQQLKRCKCGYQICVWCSHQIVDMDEKEQTEGRCIPLDKEKIAEMVTSQVGCSFPPTLQLEGGC